MREILFRGKHCHLFSCNKPLDGTWVYGHLVDDNYISDKRYMGEMLIDPSTVGQFTGLLDKNGTKIFENDILRMSIVYPTDAKCDGLVQWKNNGFWLVDGEQVYMPSEEYREVIGNIHENPELLEVKP
jgi:hypothetical protein